MLRVFGRWLLYTAVGLVLLVLLFVSADLHGGSEPKGSWRSILLSIAALIFASGGGAVLFSHRAGGALGEHWPAAAVLGWTVAAALVIGAWFSIAADIAREFKSRSRSR